MQFPKGTPKWRRYLRFWRRDVQHDVDEELRFHLESRIEELMARGVPPDRARQQALAEFGDVNTVREGLVAIDHRVATRKDRSERFAEIGSDLAFAVRSLRRTPIVTIAILATLALGVGANAAMFTFLQTVFLRMPAGVVEPEGIRRLWSHRNYASGPQFWPGSPVWYRTRRSRGHRDGCNNATGRCSGGRIRTSVASVARRSSDGASSRLMGGDCR